MHVNDICVRARAMSSRKFYAATVDSTNRSVSGRVDATHQSRMQLISLRTTPKSAAATRDKASKSKRRFYKALENTSAQLHVFHCTGRHASAAFTSLAPLHGAIHRQCMSSRQLA